MSVCLSVTLCLSVSLYVCPFVCVFMHVCLLLSLLHISSSSSSPHQSHIPVELCYSGIHPIISVTSHYVELILHEEVPLVYSAFRLSGYAPAQVSSL